MHEFEKYMVGDLNNEEYFGQKREIGKHVDEEKQQKKTVRKRAGQKKPIYNSKRINILIVSE